jgi:hypothetical protein
VTDAATTDPAQSTLCEQRKVVTAVFADLVGSTAKLIEQARRERRDRSRLALFHQADRLAVADQVALIPLVYGRSMAFVKPWVRGWWEFGKSSSAFADLVIDSVSPRA